MEETYHSMSEEKKKDYKNIKKIIVRLKNIDVKNQLIVLSKVHFKIAFIIIIIKTQSYLSSLSDPLSKLTISLIVSLIIKFIIRFIR